MADPFERGHPRLCQNSTGTRRLQKLAVQADTETTGLDPARDGIIELAMAPFTYGLDGEIYSVGEPFQQLREPSKPIPAEITAITGISDAMVAGQRIDPAAVTSLRRRLPWWSGSPQAWFIDVAEDARETEIAFLKTEIYSRDIELLVRRVDAYDRFSDRI